jgi:hypothetical protein
MLYPQALAVCATVKVWLPNWMEPVRVVPSGFGAAVKLTVPEVPSGDALATVVSQLL